MASTQYRKGNTIMWVYEVDNPHIDVNMTADRRRLPDGVASSSIGLDNSRAGRLRTANPRRPLGVSSPETDAIVSASPSEFQGVFTNIFQDEYNQTDYDDSNTDTTQIAISEAGLVKGVAFNADMVDGIIAFQGATNIPVFYARVATYVPRDTLTFDNTVASSPDTGASSSAGYELSVLYDKAYDKRGIWVSDGQRIFLIQGSTITKYIDTADSAAIGTKWFGTRISSSLFMFVNPARAPRVIALNKPSYPETASIDYAGAATISAYDSDHTGLVDYTDDITDLVWDDEFVLDNSSDALIVVVDQGLAGLTTSHAFAITINVSATTGTGDMVMMAYTDHDTVTASDKITMVKGAFLYTAALTAGFISQLGDLDGNGRWAVRIVPDSGDSLTETITSVAFNTSIAITPYDQKDTYGGLLAVDSGIDRDSYQLTMAASAGGSLSAGAYRVRMRQIDVTTGNTVSAVSDVASSASLASETFSVTASASDKITVSINATGSAPYIPNCPRATHYEIYRTIAGGSVYYLDRTVQVARSGDSVATTIELTQSDALLAFSTTLGTNALSHGGLPPIGKKIASMDGVTMIAGRADDDRVDPVFNATSGTTTIRWPIVEDDETIYFSALNASQPESFNPEDKRRLSRRGDVFQNFAVAGSVALAVMKEGVHRISISGTSVNITTVGESGIGTPWPESVVPIGDIAIWATPHGMRVYSTKTDQETGALGYLSGRGGDNLQTWLEQAFNEGDTVYCGYDDRDDVLRVRRAALFSTPFSAAAAGDILEVTSGSQADTTRLLKSATGTSLGWYIDLDDVLDNGDSFKVVTRSNDIDDNFCGYEVTTTSVQAPSGTPFSSAEVDFIIEFINGPNDGLARIIDTTSNTKMTWSEALDSAMEDEDDFQVHDTGTTILDMDTVTLASVHTNTAGITDISDGTLGDITANATDRDLGGSVATVGNSSDTITLKFDQGFSSLGTTFAIHIYVFDASPDGPASTAFMAPYVNTTQIDPFTVVSTTVGATGWRTFLLTAPFIAQLSQQGADGWWVRFGYASGGTSTFQIAEVDAKTAEFPKTSTSIYDSSGANSFSGVSVGDLIWWDTSYENEDQVRVVATQTSQQLTWTDPLPFAQRDSDNFKIIDDGSPVVTGEVDLWSLAPNGMTSIGSGAFTGVSADDYVIFNTGANENVTRKILAATNDSISWTLALDEAPRPGDSFDVANDSTTALSDTIEAEEWRLFVDSIIAPDGTSTAAQYAFKTQTWTMFDNDVGTYYAASTYASETQLPVPALYSIGREGAAFELNYRNPSHPYDTYLVQSAMSTGMTVTNSTITITTAGTPGSFTTDMIGDVIRFVSDNADIDGQVRRITAVTESSSDVLTFTPGVNGLSTDDTFIIGANHFKLRLAPWLGTKYANVKTLHGLGLFAIAGERHRRNTYYADPPTAKLDVRAYRDFHDVPISEKIDDISIGSTSGDTLEDRDRYSAVECQGQAIEIEVECVDARTDFIITHLAADVIEDNVENADASTTSGAS